MGVRELSIVLDNVPNEGYHPGATVTGRVLISSDARTHVRSLTLKVQGEAEVSFKDYVSRRRRRRIRRFRNDGLTTGIETDIEIDETSREVEIFTAHEQYFTTSYQILGETDIPAGMQEYLFSSVLPAVLPSTFSGRYGFIRYTLKIKLDKKWNFDEVAKIEFKVVAPKDLNFAQNSILVNNTIHSLSDSVVYRGMKHFYCLCCKSGPLEIAIQLSKSGVVPGETLQVLIDIDNTTKINITSVNIILNQKTSWTSRTPRTHTKITNDSLLTVKCDGVAKLNNRSWYQSIIIPAVPFINIDACSIIKLEHSIIVEAVAEGFHSNFIVQAPIIIGTIPIGANRMPDPYNLPQQNYGFVPQPSAPTEINLIQPPGFEEPPPPYPLPSQPYPSSEPPLKRY